MFKNLLPVFVAMVIVFIAGATRGIPREPLTIELQANDSLFIVHEGEFQFSIVMPKDLLIANHTIIEMGSNNELNIRCGSDFNIVAELELPNHSGVLTCPKNDHLFNYQVLDNEDQSIVFKRVLHTGSTHDYRLVQSLHNGNRAFTFQSSNDTEFNLSAVLRMKSALASVRF